VRRGARCMPRKPCNGGRRCRFVSVAARARLTSSVNSCGPRLFAPTAHPRLACGSTVRRGPPLCADGQGVVDASRRTSSPLACDTSGGSCLVSRTAIGRLPQIGRLSSDSAWTEFSHGTGSKVQGNRFQRKANKQGAGYISNVTVGKRTYGDKAVVL